MCYLGYRIGLSGDARGAVFDRIKEKICSNRSNIGIPIVACLCAFALRIVLDTSFDIETRSLFFYSAIVISAWWAGLSGGLIATLITVIFDAFFFIDGSRGWSDGPRELARLSLVGLNGALISFLFMVVRDAVSSERSAKEASEAGEKRYRALAYESSRIARNLRVSEKKYRLIFSSSPQPMWIFDRKTLGIVDVNEAALRHYGYAREEFLKLNIIDLRPQEEVPNLMRHLRENMNNEEFGAPLQAVLKHRKKTGEIIDVEVAVSNIEYDGRLVALVVVKDITAMLRAETKLREAKEAADTAKLVAEAANQAKTRFLANMSHEIRTPLGAILGFAELMKDPAQTPNDRLDCISTILRNGELLSRVINDILDLSKIESERLEIERIACHPLELLGEVTALLNLQAQEKGLELNIVVSQGTLPKRVLTDPTRLRQILINMIGNAIKFTARGSVEVQIESRPKKDDPGRFVLEFLIRDTGSGISEEQQERLFQPFLQADTSTTRIYGGTGLGLVLSQRLARALGGDLSLQSSQPGQGSTFALTVDIGSQDELNALELKAAHEVKVAHSESRVINGVFAWTDPVDIKVLLVEDAPDNRVLVSRFIKAAGARVECVENGLEGVREALSGCYDLILMDIQMPRMDGFEAVRLLRREGYRKPIVALTAHAMKEDREQCLVAGFDDHLVKPLNRAALLATLRRFAKATPLVPVDHSNPTATPTALI